MLIIVNLVTIRNKLRLFVSIQLDFQQQKVEQNHGLNYAFTA